MSLRAEAVATHPGFPWLAADDPAGVASYLRARGWLSAGEAPERVERAGEGNMNLTLRIVTNRRSLVLKQARPWVEKYDHIAAPWERARFEGRFYARVAAIPAVAAAMPQLLGTDDDAHTLLLEDLPGARDLTGLYAGARLTEAEGDALADYLAALHAATRGAPDPGFANRAMRELSYAHIFVVPYQRDNGIDLEAHEPGLTAAAEQLATDDAFRGALAATAQRYLVDGPCLVHGDYFPGSWLRTPGGPRVIDPEFCFYGDAEVDVGCALAHLALARQDPRLATRFLARYGAADQARAAHFAAAEIARRLLGVAQLPIPPSDGFRAALLARARDAMVSGSLAGLHG